jgi:hypothetical protein
MISVYVMDYNSIIIDDIMDYRLVIETHNNVCKFIYWIVLSNILRMITIHYLDEPITAYNTKICYINPKS